MHIMIDLETMGTSPDAAIVAIGAVAFDKAEVYSDSAFYRVIDLKTSMATGGRVDAGTVYWWLQQSTEARAALVAEPHNIETALYALNNWIGKTPVEGVWGNGATFDNVVLRRAYERCGVAVPWSYKQDRCYRTLLALSGVQPMPRQGMHNAVADALYQAEMMLRIQDTPYKWGM